MNAIRRERELEAARNPPPPAPQPVPERFNWTPPKPRPSWLPATDADLKQVARDACLAICKEADPPYAWEGFREELRTHDMPPRLREELEETVRDMLTALHAL